MHRNRLEHFNEGVFVDVGELAFAWSMLDHRGLLIPILVKSEAQRKPGLNVQARSLHFELDLSSQAMEHLKWQHVEQVCGLPVAASNLHSPKYLVLDLISGW